MNKTISNIAARDEVLARIQAAPAKKQFSSDWTRAKYLARGEMIRGIVGGFANSVIFSPAGARSDRGQDMMFFYGHTGALVHEEPARGDVRAALGFAA